MDIAALSALHQQMGLVLQELKSLDPNHETLTATVTDLRAKLAAAEQELETLAARRQTLSASLNEKLAQVQSLAGADLTAAGKPAPEAASGRRGGGRRRAEGLAQTTGAPEATAPLPPAGDSGGAKSHPAADPGRDDGRSDKGNAGNGVTATEPNSAGDDGNSGAGLAAAGIEPGSSADQTDHAPTAPATDLLDDRPPTRSAAEHPIPPRLPGDPPRHDGPAPEIHDAPPELPAPPPSGRSEAAPRSGEPNGDLDQPIEQREYDRLYEAGYTVGYNDSDAANPHRFGDRAKAWEEGRQAGETARHDQQRALDNSLVPPPVPAARDDRERSATEREERAPRAPIDPPDDRHRAAERRDLGPAATPRDRPEPAPSGRQIPAFLRRPSHGDGSGSRQ